MNEQEVDNEEEIIEVDSVEVINFLMDDVAELRSRLEELPALRRQNELYRRFIIENILPRYVAQPSSAINQPEEEVRDGQSRSSSALATAGSSPNLDDEASSSSNESSASLPPLGRYNETDVASSSTSSEASASLPPRGRYLGSDVASSSTSSDASASMPPRGRYRESDVAASSTSSEASASMPTRRRFREEAKTPDTNGKKMKKN